MSGLAAGDTLGGYRILARMRAGAMGVLYLGRRVGPAGFSRPVAIKVIHEHLAQNKRFVRMFVDEAKLSARIDDPNVVRVEEFGEVGGRYYLVMEYVHGCSLAEVLRVLKRKRERLSVDVAVAIAMQMCAGLHGAHEATDEDGQPLGLVHRDVSPQNVLVSFKGAVRIIDFGIAKAKQVGGQTKTGSLRGKLAYMPPEQARSARTVDRRADLYAVGLVLWEMLTGRPVFDAETDLAILNQLRNPQVVPPSELVPEVPAALDAVVVKALAQDPDARPPDLAELQRMLGDAVPSARRVLPRDIAVVLEKVRLAVTSADGSDDDDLRSTLASYGKSMHESVALADEALGAAKDEPIPSEREPALVVEDEKTWRMLAKDVPVDASPMLLSRRASNAPPPPPRPSQPRSRQSRASHGNHGTMRVSSASIPPDSTHALPRPSIPPDSMRASIPPASHSGSLFVGPASSEVGRVEPRREPTNDEVIAEIKRYFMANPWAAGVVVVVPLVLVAILVALSGRPPAPAVEPIETTPPRAFH